MAARIKAGPIRDLADARYLNALDAEVFLTFSFDALDPGTVTVEQAKEIIGWLHEPAVVAAFGMHQEEEEISYVLGCIGVNAIEVPAEHKLATGNTDWLTFVRHTVEGPDEMPDLALKGDVCHIIDLHPLSSISLQKWEPLLKLDRIFLCINTADTTNLPDKWQPYGWDLNTRGVSTGISEKYGEILERMIQVSKAQ